MNMSDDLRDRLAVAFEGREDASDLVDKAMTVITAEPFMIVLDEPRRIAESSLKDPGDEYWVYEVYTHTEDDQ